MVNTYLSYQLITRDLAKSIDRVEAQPGVQRDTAYYLANIGKVKSIDDFLKDDRLYRYAMKAHGLETMSYAKAFIKKALTEGVSDPNSFANKLTDKRYAEFVKNFNFAAMGEMTTVYTKAQHEAVSNYLNQVSLEGGNPQSKAVQDESNYYLANISKVKSIDEFMANDRLYAFAIKAYGIESSINNKDMMRKVLEGGIRDPNSFANSMIDRKYATFAAAFDFEAHGENATIYNPAQQPAVAKYMRQTLEEDAGVQNEGVRLGLYFERKAPDIKNFYDILADPALAKVARTALGLPDSFAASDIDRQAKLFDEKLNIDDFTDPEKLGKFLTRFTSLWEVSNSTSSQPSIAILYQPVELGISTNTLLAIQQMKR
ncbi:MAG: DUF1217 domain-containing protein [Mesorhizobium sp.]